jgi:hypothetical protein
LKAFDDYEAPWLMDAFAALAGGGPYGDGRVLIGWAHDNIYMPAEVLKPYFAAVRKAGAHLITSHGVGGPSFGDPASSVEILDGHGLLDKDILISHANYPHEGDAEKLKKSGATISTTPNTELQMGLPLVALKEDFEANASIGVDAHSWGSSSMCDQMRLLLQSARLERQHGLAEQDKWSRHTGFSVEQVFNLATIGGARAVGLSDHIGKLEVGKEADIVIFDGTSPSMLAAADEDPVAAIVLHSSPRDVESVIIGGVVRKEHGRLLDVTVADSQVGHKATFEPRRSLSWNAVSREVLNSRKRLNEAVAGLDMGAAEDVIMDMYYMTKGKMLEQV